MKLPKRAQSSSKRTTVLKKKSPRLLPAAGATLSTIRDSTRISNRTLINPTMTLNGVATVTKSNPPKFNHKPYTLPLKRPIPGALAFFLTNCAIIKLTRRSNESLSLKNEQYESPIPMRRLGQKVVRIFGERLKDERLIADSGVATEKGPRSQNEDNSYYNPKEGIVGVFDGTGGLEKATKASTIATYVMREEIEDSVPETVEDMRLMMESMNDAIYYDPASGHSTAAIGRVIENKGQKSILYSSVGNSRIYLIRNDKAKQITTDEGSGDVLYNSLGRQNADIKQVGKISLQKGDYIVFCTDGVANDSESESLSHE